MLLRLFTTLPSNILSNLNYLKQDFIGFNLNLSFITNFILGFVISISFLLVSLLIGYKIRCLFFKKITKDISYLVDIALGTILIGTGIAILGFFSLLKTPILFSYLAILLFIALFRFNLDYIKDTAGSLLGNLNSVKKNKFVCIWLTLFILLALVNLINPEIREDQYHVDLPKMYLSKATIMIPPKEQFHVSASPLLSEMSYTIGIFLWSEESARYIHFIFYLLVLFTLFKFSQLKEYKFLIYAPLLFASAPVVIHETSSMYVDFQWIFYSLLSILLLVRDKKITHSTVFLSGILLGGMVSSKLWTIVFIPASLLFLIYLLRKNEMFFKFKKGVLFILGILIISSVWFIRSFILTGNIFYPAFTNQTSLENINSNFDTSHYLGFNVFLLNPINLVNVFSPIFFVGVLFLIFKVKNNFNLLKNLDLSKYAVLITILYLVIQYSWGRYLMGLYVFLIVSASLGIYNALNNIKYAKLVLNLILFLFFGYYIINSLFVLPYALGFSDKNKYLTRILSRDNSSYYNFDNKFDRYISNKDYVATYGVFGYYYANFNYIDVNSIYSKRGEPFNRLKENMITKLFIKGGDITYFCNIIYLTDCNSSKYELISEFNGTQPYFLYKIK